MTLSKSCSDKLALTQCTSLLSSPVSLVVSPENAYIDSLILPYHQYRQHACERAFGPAGRMSPVVSSTWLAGYGFRPFQVKTTSVDFCYSRRAAALKTGGCRGSNTSAVWTPRHQETLIHGVLQGRKQTDRRGASALSKIQTWNLLLEIIGMLGVPALMSVVTIDSYQGMKNSQDLEHRRRVKEHVKGEALRGWSKVSSDIPPKGVLQPQSPTCRSTASRDIVG